MSTTSGGRQALPAESGESTWRRRSLLRVLPAFPLLRLARVSTVDAAGASGVVLRAGLPVPVLVTSAPGVAAATRTAVPGAPRIPDVMLADQDGKPVRLATLLEKRVVAVNFIYTSCATFCPPQTAIFRQLQQLLESSPLATSMLVSIAIDPVNDTPRALTAYASRFDARLGRAARWTMLTGGIADIDRVLAGFGLHRGGLADHPAQVWVGNVAAGRWRRALGLAQANDLLGWLQELDQ